MKLLLFPGKVVAILTAVHGVGLTQDQAFFLQDTEYSGEVGSDFARFFADLP